MDKFSSSRVPKLSACTLYRYW